MGFQELLVRPMSRRSVVGPSAQPQQCESDGQGHRGVIDLGIELVDDSFRPVFYWMKGHGEGLVLTPGCKPREPVCLVLPVLMDGCPASGVGQRDMAGL